MFKDIFHWVILLITQPAKAWEELKEKEETEDQFLSRFVYPLIGLMGVVAFLGVLLTRKEFDSELALKLTIKVVVAAFGGFFLAAYVLNEVWHGYFKREKDLKLWYRFVGYSSVLMYTINMVQTLLPEFFFLKVFVLYTFYMIWEGTPSFMQIEEKDRLRFVSITTAVVILTPEFIGLFLEYFMPGLRNIML